MDREEPSQHFAMRGKPVKEYRGVRLRSRQFGQAILTVDQLDRQRWGHLAQASEVSLHVGDLSPCQSLGEVVQSRLVLPGDRTGRVSDRPRLRPRRELGWQAGSMRRLPDHGRCDRQDLKGRKA